MGHIRTVITGYRHAALLLFLAALLVRALVPSGYMFASRDGLPTVEFCDGMIAAPMPDTAMMAMHHHGPHQDTPEKKPKKGEMPCAFAGVSVSSALGADQILPSTAIWFLSTTLAFGNQAERSIRVAFPHERPLLRGPPVRQ